MDPVTCKILLAVTGSVATIKLPLLIKAILDSNIPGQEYIFETSKWSWFINHCNYENRNQPQGGPLFSSGSITAPLLFLRTMLVASFFQSVPVPTRSTLKQHIVSVIVTEHSKHFFDTSDIPNYITVQYDENEWHSWSKRGDPVLHIELGKMADMMVIAPLDANTLAKMAQGICDNLLTCTTRAWDLSKPLLFCPAMNTRMWQHPVTAKQIATLKEWGHEEIPPIEKTLMCGDTGIGAMAEVDTIVERIKSVAKKKFLRK